jgi:hypothetical protein
MGPHDPAATVCEQFSAPKALTWRYIAASERVPSRLICSCPAARSTGSGRFEPLRLPAQHGP